LPETKDLLPIVTIAECAQKFEEDMGHGARFCCKTALSLWYTKETSGHMNFDWDWVYLVDDDVYVFLDHLQLKLCHDFSDGAPKVVGIPGCNTKQCGGMCGGGGFGFSRADLKRFLGEGDKDSFLKEFIQTCERCENWDDVTVGTLAEIRGMRQERMPGSEPWQLDLESQIDKALSFHELPTIWHYVRDDMSKVHRIHKTAGEVMTLRHYTGNVMTLADVPHVAEHSKRIRKSLGLEDKTKFLGKKTRLELFWDDSSCTTEHITVGRFQTAEECAPHVIASSRCGNHFMLSPGQFVWGCRCCDSVDTKMGASAWKVYHIVEDPR